MAGASIEITIDDAEVLAALNRLVAAGGDLTPAMRDIGEHLLNTTRERFSEEKAPDGTPWAPLSETTKKRKRRNAGKILTRDGFLRGNLAYRESANSVVVGSPSIYRGTHQFGAEQGSFGSTSGGSPIPFGDIPARPFLGVSNDDADAITRIIRDFIAEGLAGRT